MTAATGHDARSIPHRVERKLRRALKSARQHLLRRSVQQHVFVAGMQRSGTNMLMDLLDASHETRVFHETDPRAFVAYQMRERSVIRDLAQRCPAPVLVIKALCELDLLSSLMAEFAPAKTLWVVREWRESVTSAIRSFGGFVRQWNRLAHEAASDDWRGRGMSEESRSVLRSLFRQNATESDGAAIMWYYRNILFFQQAFEADRRVRLVFYEDLVRQPVREMRAITEFLGIDELPAREVGGIHARSTDRHAHMAVTPEIQDLCDGLHRRFVSLRERPPS